MAGDLRYLTPRGDAFYARRVIPKALRPYFNGKTERRIALGSNKKLAERALHAAMAQIEDEFAAARAKLDVVAFPQPRIRARPLTTDQIARTHYAEELEIDRQLREGKHCEIDWSVERDLTLDGLPSKVEVPDEDEPTNVWPIKSRLTLYQERAAREPATQTQPGELAHSGFTPPSPRHRELQVKALRRVASGQSNNDEMQAVVGWAVEKFQARGSTAVEAGSGDWRSLARTLAQVQLAALEATIERDAGYEPSPPKLPILAESATPTTVVPIRLRGPAVPILDLLDGYLRTLKAQGKGAAAELRWRPVFKNLVRYLGYDDARQLTKADIAGWRDHLLENEKLAPKTIRDVHLASLRAVLRWAADNDKIAEDPAARVRIDVAKKVRTREKGLDDTEAAAVLKAVLSYQAPAARSSSTRESPHRSAAKRWLPWLCALTGARVAEMAQLRGQDVQIRDGITYLRITPDAGSVKSGHYRDVPVHPQLVSIGFLDFVRAAGNGPLFYDVGKVRKSPLHPSKIVASHIAAWVRSLGLIDDSVDPSHGWRHRFKTVGREAGINDRILDALQGHAGRTAGDDYGDVTLKTRDAAIRRIPAYKVG
ncbi:site-specific integrase [Methylobacterium planeticum]|uniref:Site-specific integrase n=1 Tax=Methylobacterium planeticum TaxID=2615211 RepID=A0A6N6MFK4_9HYPH|nr:site-specific integrase [Methylobacterium planeticum]KAB1068558.1 site-specific integrase [Methylobacterium planeticum]